ncbi:MAG: HD domain-containing protein [Candidatus Riflebacteria bacterium]|nr:HD domain-containing protein [Candidatus Riflebacteria bacterium]
MTNNLSQNSLSFPHAQALAGENALLKSQILELIQLEDSGNFVDTDSIIKNFLKKARILSKAEAAFFALPASAPGKLEIKIAPPNLDDVVRNVCAEFENGYDKWIASENELLSIAGFIVLPLIRRHRLIGVMGLKLNPAAPENVCELLSSFAKQAATTLENTLFHEKSFRRLLTLSNVFTFQRELGGQIDLEIILDKVLSLIRDGTSSVGAALHLLGESGNDFFMRRLQTNQGIIEFSPNLKLFDETVKKTMEKGDPEVFEFSQIGELLRPTAFQGSSGFSENILCVPIFNRQKIVGIVQVFGKSEKQQYSPEDFELVKLLSGQIAFFIESTQQFQSLRELFFQTIDSLIWAFESRDSFFKGHSRRVAEFANELGLKFIDSKKELDDLKLAAIIHDLGKFQLPLEILYKPSLLTLEEFEIVKKHPQLGEHYFETIGYLEQIRRIVRYHHERIDGGGYPEGLKGEKIPLASRILAIVDAFEAMTSMRPYRPPYSEEKALKELIKMAGTQFDSRLVEEFVKMKMPALLVSEKSEK